MTTETREEFHRKLYSSQVDFDELADWYFDLSKEEECLREALRFYADQANWRGMVRKCVIDDGETARKALDFVYE